MAMQNDSWAYDNPARLEAETGYVLAVNIRKIGRWSGGRKHS
jgi:hypothetical protein